jgi:PKD repeat protein
MFVKKSIVLLMCILLFVLCVAPAYAGDGITYPSEGTINDFIFTIQASASGDIEYVRFYLHGDDNAAGVNNWKNDGFWYYQDDYSSPYGATWNMVGIPNTRYTTMIWIKYKNGSMNEEPGGRVYFNAYPNSWITGSWGSCSPSCGNGNQSRTIQCVNPNGTVLPNPDKDCYGITKPDSTQSCYTYCPTYSWESDYWTSCNAPDNCGSGTQELIYKCVDDKNNTVSNSKCSGSPQTKTQSCEEVSGCVYHWEYGSWGNCSETCGTGTKTRNAFCKDQSENSVSDSKCSGTPDTTDNCTETSGCRSPVATILSIDPTSSEIAETISFKGSGNDPDSGAISAYQWRSSIDGELSTQASFSTSNLSVGTHTIYFKVQDNEGVWSTSVERDITINQEQCTNPEASFSTNIQTGELPLDVQFTDQSVATQDDSIVSWEWDFGDGSDSSEQHPGHIYHTAGRYTVSLKVKNSCGQDVETKMNLIVVGKSNDSDDVDLSKGLVAYYPFNGNANDESGNGNHGTIKGDISFLDSFIDKCICLSSEGDYVELAKPLLADIQNWTVSSWINIKPTSSTETTSHVHPLYGEFSNSWTTKNLLVLSQSKIENGGFCKPAFDNYPDSNGPDYDAPFDLNPNQWYFVTFVKNVETIIYYVNGDTFGYEVYENYTGTSPSKFFIGYRDLYTNNYNCWYSGQIDELRFYERVLSDNEIKALYKFKLNHLHITPITNELPSTSGSTTFTVTSNTNWTATTTAYWLTIQSNPNTITAIYEENPGETRTATITVSAEGASLSPQYIEITQSQKENSLPEANNQEVTTSTNESIKITLLATDTDNDSLTFTILTLPSNGTISNDPPNIIYTPDLDYQGVDEFTFKANDGTADSNIAHVSIQINPIPTTRHFIDVDGNPADNTWTIYLSSATLDGVDLQANDEIAIFDNETMVGSFKISEVLSDTNQLKNYLTAWSTLSDGDGYQAGHPYTFKCWDISQQKEYTCFHPILTNPYEDAFTGDVFPDGDAKYSIVRLNFLTSITQTIQLSTGYRFVSLNVLPDETEMTEILSPVLDHIDFAKDSKGNLLRKIGPDWINNIGLWKNTAGYLLRLNNNAVLNIEGLPVYPEIPVDLNPGYQFVAYLLTEPTDALSAFSDILEHLDFAKDSFGNLFRKIGPNWVNNIGELNPGEGYLLKMNAADRLFYEKPVQIQRKSYRHKDTKQVSHFGEISGNPADATWTIYLAQAQLNETHLEANDEIAIFDGNKLVGAFQLTEPLTEEKQNNHYITAWSTLNDGDGYTAGNTYTFKCWDSSAGLEYSNDELTLLNPYNDAYTDAVFPFDDANYSIATIVFSETSLKPGDMNDDGIIDLKDAVWILKMLVGME